MPKYEVDLNGQKFEIDAPDENALSIAVKHLQSDGGATAAKPSDPGGWSVDNVVRSLGRGALGVGSYLDEANAATNATLAPLIDPILPDSYQKLPGGTWGERYDQALGIQRGKDKAFDDAHPIASTALNIAGGIGSGGAVLKAAPAIGNFVLGNGGASLGTRAAATIGSAGGTGFVQGFGAGEEGASDRLKQGLVEGAVGAGTGAAMMPVASGFSKATQAVFKALSGESDDALSAMGKAGREYVVRELADPDKVTMLRGSLDDLGPEAMLADVSPDWLGVARGAAARPGTRGMVVDPLNARSDMANTRLRGDVASNLGPDPVPSRINREIEGNMDQVAREYGPVMRERQTYDFSPITDDLENSVMRLRGDAQRDLQRVRGMMNVHGQDMVSTDPQIAFETRQAIDGMLKTEQNPKVISALTEARQMIDDGLRDSVPRIKEVDAQYHELGRQQEALGMGRPILNNEASAMRPEELSGYLMEGANPEGMLVGPSGVPTRAKQGTLGEIYRAIGTKANDTTALRNIVRGEGDWNREKLGMLFGQEPADNVLNAIDRETVFGDTANRVTRGSDTQMANRFTKFLDEIEKAQDIPADTTMAGMGVKALRSVFSAMMQKNAGVNASQVAEDIGRLSVAQSPQREAIMDALLRRGEKNVVDERRMAVVRAMLQSAGRSGYSSLPGVRN